MMIMYRHLAVPKYLSSFFSIYCKSENAPLFFLQHNPHPSLLLFLLHSSNILLIFLLLLSVAPPPSFHSSFLIFFFSLSRAQRIADCKREFKSSSQPSHSSSPLPLLLILHLHLILLFFSFPFDISSPFSWAHS